MDRRRDLHGLAGGPVLASACPVPPDLTAAGAIATLKADANADPRYNETYNLGATGLRGWIYVGGGSAADGTFTDTTDLLINATNGNVVDPNAPTPTDDFSVAGSVGQWAAFGTNFSVTLSGMASADSTPGPNLGAKLSDGGIERASNGDFGIQDNDDVGPNTAGIDALEGLLVGLDASNLDPSLAFQITGIEVGGVNAPETGTIVNRNDTSKSVGFSASGLVDVNSLDLIINGGISDSETGLDLRRQLRRGQFPHRWVHAEGREQRFRPVHIEFPRHRSGG